MIFKGVYKIYGSDPRQKQQSRYYKKNSRETGELHIDNMPDNKNGKFGDNFKGGEYIDYEEVK